MEQSQQFPGWPADQVGVEDDGAVETGQVLEGPILIALRLEFTLIDHHFVYDPVRVIHLHIELLQHADADAFEPKGGETYRSKPLHPPADGVDIVLPQLPRERVVPVLDTPRIPLQQALSLHPDEG